MKINARESNYTMQKELAKSDFMKWDQQPMIDKFQLEYDDSYLYINFLAGHYRINRSDGTIERLTAAGIYTGETDYNEVMSIYDVLCCSVAAPSLTGRWSAVNNLKHTIQSAGNHLSLFASYAVAFTGKTAALIQACEQLNGVKSCPGDVCYQIPVFDFLPVMLQFWEGDEEFPSRLCLLWDENTLDYLHYETTFFIAFHMLERIKMCLEV